LQRHDNTYAFFFVEAMVMAIIADGIIAEITRSPP
jgi:uncharacterized membrane protein YebE (DUF533 family)